MTTVGGWQPGTRINLERALKVGDELGGHIVAGHADGLATADRARGSDRHGAAHLRAPAELARFIAPKGSVALDGVSLTVNEVADDTFSVLIIPHTLAVTTLGALVVGDAVNLEVDLMARYAARLMETSIGVGNGGCHAGGHFLHRIAPFLPCGHIDLARGVGVDRRDGEPDHAGRASARASRRSRSRPR